MAPSWNAGNAPRPVPNSSPGLTIGEMLKEVGMLEQSVDEEVLDNPDLESACERFLRDKALDPGTGTFLEVVKALPPDDRLPHIWRVGPYRITVTPTGKGRSVSRRVAITDLRA